MSARPSLSARNTTVPESGEKAGFSCWSSPGISTRSRMPPSSAFSRSISRPRSRRANTATVLPSGDTPMSAPPSGPVVSHWLTRYS